MSKFRQRDGDLFVAPPFGVTMNDVFVFVLPANKAKLQAICDNDLSIGSEVFRPLGAFAIFYAASIENLVQGTNTAAIEGGFWIPVCVEREGKTQLLTYSPYVWLTSATSTRVGRTLYGYPKQVGQVTIPSEGGSLAIEVNAETLVTGAEPGTYHEAKRPVVIARQPAGSWQRPPTEGLSKWVELTKLATDVTKELVSTPDIEVDELPQLIEGMRSIFLKQVPGASELDPPVYQALIEAAIKPKVTSVSGKRLTDAKSWRVTVPSYAQPRIAETLGLVGDTSASGLVVTPLAAAWMEFEGQLEAGREIWRSPGG